MTTDEAETSQTVITFTELDRMLYYTIRPRLCAVQFYGLKKNWEGSVFCAVRTFRLFPIKKIQASIGVLKREE